MFELVDFDFVCMCAYKKSKTQSIQRDDVKERDVKCLSFKQQSTNLYCQFIKVLKILIYILLNYAYYLHFNNMHEKR